ncbi:MAG: RDD family protein [Candidatus Acidiferrales bacterium]
MFCSKCGSQVADTSAFCPSCGQPTTGQPAAPRGIPLAPSGFTPQPAASAPSTAIPPAMPAAYPPTAVARPIGYAGFWLRFVAWIIDRIILGVAFSFISFPLMAASTMRTWIGHPPQSPEELIAFVTAFSKIALLALVFNWLYYALLESSAWQATIGKKTLGLEVTDMAGRRISFARASGRFFGKIISALILWIGYIMAGFTAQKQALHDIMAGCLVMRKI